MSHTRTPNNQDSYSLIAQSLLLRESAINTAQTMDRSIIWEGDLPQLIARNPADDSNQRTGTMLGTKLTRAGHTVAWSPSQPQARPQHIAWLMGYGLGSVTTTAPDTGVYLHALSPQSGNNLPTSTVMARHGGGTEAISIERYAGCAVDQFTLATSGDYLSIQGSVLGTGYCDSDVEREIVAGLDNATSLTLAAKGILGSTAGERLTNLHAVLCSYQQVTNRYVTDVTVSAASAAEPAVLTITSVGGAGASVDYLVIYRTKTGVSWTTFPATVSEDPYRVGNATIKIGGDWNGTTYVGGKTYGCDVRALSISWANNATVQFCMSGSGDYGDRIYRGRPTLALTMDRELWDWVHQVYARRSENLSLYAKWTQATAITGSYYPYCEVIIPEFGIESHATSEADGLIVESLNCKGLNGSYAGLLVNLQDTIATVAA